MASNTLTSTTSTSAPSTSTASSSTPSTSTTILHFDPSCTRFAAISETGLHVYNLSSADKSLELKYKDGNILETLREKHQSKTDTIFLIEHHYEKPIVALITNENRSKLYLLDYEKNLFRGMDVEITIMALKFYRGFAVVFYDSCCECFLIDDWEEKTETNIRPRDYRDIPFDAGSLVAIAPECTGIDGFLVAYHCNGAKNPGKVKIDKGIERPELGGYIEWSDYGWFEPLDQSISLMAFNSSGTRLAVAVDQWIHVYSILPSLEYLVLLGSYYICHNKGSKFISISISKCGQYLVADTSGEYAYAVYLWEAKSTAPDFAPHIEKRGVAIKFKENVNHICGITKVKHEFALMMATTNALYVYSMPKSLDEIKLFNGYHLDLNSSVSKSKCMSKDEVIASLDINYPSFDEDDIDWNPAPLKYEAITPDSSVDKTSGPSYYTTEQLVQMFLGYTVYGDSKRNYLYCHCDALAKGADLAKKSQLQPHRPQSMVGYIVSVVVEKLRSIYDSWKNRVIVNDDDEPLDRYVALKDIAAKEEAFKKYLQTAVSQPCHYTCSCYKN